MTQNPPQTLIKNLFGHDFGALKLTRAPQSSPHIAHNADGILKTRKLDAYNMTCRSFIHACRNPQNNNNCLPEIFRPLSAGRIQSERAEPLVQRHGHGSDVERHKYSDPQAGTEGQQKRQQRHVCFPLRRDHHRHAAVEIRRGEVHPLRPGK